MKRKITDQEKEVFEYLNDLRESENTNMFGARPYIISEFGLPSNEAKRILLLWMSNFNKDGNYDEITDLLAISESPNKSVN